MVESPFSALAEDSEHAECCSTRPAAQATNYGKPPSSRQNGKVRMRLISSTRRGAGQDREREQAERRERPTARCFGNRGACSAIQPANARPEFLVRGVSVYDRRERAHGPDEMKRAGGATGPTGAIRDRFESSTCFR